MKQCKFLFALTANLLFILLNLKNRKNKGVLNLKYPIERGIIMNWDNIEKLWSYVFSNELEIDSSMYPCLMSETPFNPKKNREKITELMFEKYNVPCFYMALQSILSLYAAGLTTGCVLGLNLNFRDHKIVKLYNFKIQEMEAQV